MYKINKKTVEPGTIGIKLNCHLTRVEIFDLFNIGSPFSQVNNAGAKRCAYSDMWF